MASTDRPLVWLHGEIKTPPFSREGRVEAGVLLRRLQRGDVLLLPHSRLMPRVGARCHELRIPDAQKNWRLIYRTDHDAIVIAAIWNKTTRTTPDDVIKQAKRRLRLYDEATEWEEQR